MTTISNRLTHRAVLGMMLLEKKEGMIQPRWGVLRQEYRQKALDLADQFLVTMRNEEAAAAKGRAALRRKFKPKQKPLR